MTPREKMKEIARANVDRHLGDVCDGDATADVIHEEVRVLALDALIDAIDDVDEKTAGEIANELANEIAQDFT
jgi:hypothetical protein